VFFRAEAQFSCGVNDDAMPWAKRRLDLHAMVRTKLRGAMIAIAFDPAASATCFAVILQNPHNTTFVLEHSAFTALGWGLRHGPQS
jgi:hypothetical protein